MQGNNVNENDNLKQGSTQNKQNSVYSVQSLNIESDQTFEINYKGTPMLTTKEVFTDLLKKAETFDKAKESYFKMKQNKERYENGYNEAIEKYKAEMKKNSALEQEVAKLKEKLANVERGWQAEKAVSQQLGEKLAKFTNNHANMPSKKAVFSEADKQGLLRMFNQRTLENPKYTIRDLHEEVMMLGRQKGNKKMANVSYETVRTVIAEMKRK